MKNEWSGISRSLEEDLELTSIFSDYRTMTSVQSVLFLLTSALILGVYLLINHSFSPGYPVITTFAEENSLYAEHYPPFRMSEWTSYSITEDIISGKLYSEESLSLRHPIGYPLLSVPLTMTWGEAGPYYTNAVIMWLSALFFFLLMLEIAPFYLALCSTLVLAFATPNIFFAASAFPEPTAQLFTVIALLFFLKGMSPGHEQFFFALAGFTAGLNLFVQPVMALMAVLFALAMLYEHRRWALYEWGLYMLLGGFLITLIPFLIAFKLFPCSFTEYIFSTPYYLDNLSSQAADIPNTNIIAGIWKLLFDNPHGLIFIMPIIIFVPHGFTVMWRLKLKSVFIISAILVAVIILIAAASPYPITGECVGSRLLVSVLPLLIIPLVFTWDEYTGEKILLVVTLIMTVYMSTFGWWAGVSKGKGFFIGLLQDRDARMILLARKDKLQRPVFSSTNEIEKRFFRSLKRRDMKRWLQTLDHESIVRIHGFERAVFNNLANIYRNPEINPGQFIRSVDPDRGVRLFLPALWLNEDSVQNDTFMKGK